VTGLTDEVWPLRAKPNPFIPPALQRRAGIPEASAEATLARAKRVTDGWRSAAGEVIVSFPTMEEDRVLIASPLIATVSEAAPEAVCASPPLRYRDAIFSLRTIETLDDARAPALATTTPRGGTRILSDQAACPFRAFARHRLAAESLEEPVDGPDPRARGLLLHELMRALWNELRDSEALHGDCGPAIEKAAAAAVAEARLEEPFAALERARLARLAREWLDIERARAPFEVAATESKRRLSVAGLDLSGRIDRLDRLASGGHALIDYKSGRVTPNEWMNVRPDDPQLPLYAVNAEEDIAAVAFAKLKTGEMRYMGFSRDKDVIPGVKQAQDWDALLSGWKREIESLGAGFAAGDARVDPKRPPQTCTYCGLQPLCRVHERSPAPAGDESDAAGEE
jgi:probable DNA repair protein